MQCPFDPCKQLPHTKRLGDVIGSAVIERSHNFVLVIHDGDIQYRNVGGL